MPWIWPAMTSGFCLGRLRDGLDDLHRVLALAPVPARLLGADHLAQLRARVVAARCGDPVGAGGEDHAVLGRVELEELAVVLGQRRALDEVRAALLAGRQRQVPVLGVDQLGRQVAADRTAGGGGQPGRDPRVETRRAGAGGVAAAGSTTASGFRLLVRLVGRRGPGRSSSSVESVLGLLSEPVPDEPLSSSEPCWPEPTALVGTVLIGAVLGRTCPVWSSPSRSSPESCCPRWSRRCRPGRRRSGRRPTVRLRGPSAARACSATARRRGEPPVAAGRLRRGGGAGGRRDDRGGIDRGELLGRGLVVLRCAQPDQGDGARGRRGLGLQHHVEQVRQLRGRHPAGGARTGQGERAAGDGDRRAAAERGCGIRRAMSTGVRRGTPLRRRPGFERMPARWGAVPSHEPCPPGPRLRLDVRLRGEPGGMGSSRVHFVTGLFWTHDEPRRPRAPVASLTGSVR